MHIYIKIYIDDDIQKHMMTYIQNPSIKENILNNIFIHEDILHIKISEKCIEV